MDRCQSEQQLREPQKDRVGQAGRGDRDRDIHKERIMVFDQLTADRIADARATEGEQHFRQTAAQQEGESTARERRREAELRWTVQPVNMLDVVKRCVKLCAGHEDALRREVRDELLETVQLRGIDAGVREAERLRHALLAIEAVIRE